MIEINIIVQEIKLDKYIIFKSQLTILIMQKKIDPWSILIFRHDIDIIHHFPLDMSCKSLN